MLQWHRCCMLISAIDHMRSLFAATGLSRERSIVAARVLWRGALLGIALYLLLGDDPSVNLKLNGVSFIVAMVWSYYDGAFSRRRWSIAWSEGLIMHLAGVQVANILSLIVGHPLTTG